MLRWLLALGLSVFAVASAQAQAPSGSSAAPAGMSQEQFDALVDAISNSVTQKLKTEGALAPAPAPAAAAPAAPPAAAKPAPSSSSGKGAKGPPPPKIIVTAPKEGPHPVAVFLDRAGKVIEATPAMLAKVATFPRLFDRSAQGGRGAMNFLLLLGVIALVAVTAEAALRRVTAGLRGRLAAFAPPAYGWHSIMSLLGLAALDGLGVVAVWGICQGAAGAWFAGTTGQDRLAVAVLTAIWEWRAFVLIFRIVLQPDQPAARLCAADDAQASIMYRRVSTVLIVMALGRLVGAILRAIDTAPEAFASYQVVFAMIYLGLFLWMAFGARHAAQQWFGGLSEAAPVVGVVGRRWIPIAPIFLGLLAVMLVYGAVSGQPHAGTAMFLTLKLVVGVLIFETLMQAVVRRLDSQLVGRTPAGDAPKLPDVIARCIRVAVLIGAFVVIAESWVVDVLGLVDEGSWTQLTNSSRTAAFTLFAAFVVWELFKYATEPYMERKNKDAATAIAEGDAAGPPASRISTMMPLLRRATATMIALVAVMVALDDFGINITPLIAGASVFGIAISFGSQTLVRDIVSGLFYLSDDAFRVGEYIDCGKAKGTVEGFTLRSIKLRHQNGQVHTIPFGQLGQITNFSRDWITVKFNLRFARDTDIEKLRKAAKKIGAEIAELPQFKDEILAPFKMQGVADIVENALLIRFKFTARPGNPAAIQREAVKRMFGTLPALGIEFAKEGAAVVLHTGAPVETAKPAPESTAAAEPGTVKAAAS